MESDKTKWFKNLTPKLDEDSNVQEALNWWHSLPIQDIEECKFGWANLCMKYYPSKTECYHFTSEEILNIYEKECINK